MLNDVQIRRAKPAAKQFKLHDGDGLFLLVRPNGRKAWVFRFWLHGRERGMRLGSYPATSLKQARDRRDAARSLLEQNRDPVHERRVEHARHENTFKGLATEWLDMQAESLAAVSLRKSRRQLERWAFPAIGSKSVLALTPHDVLALLRRVESQGKNETAHRVRSLIDRVLTFAVSTHRADRNVCADLPRDALAPVVVEHHAALTDPRQVGQLLRDLHAYQGQVPTMFALKLLPLLFVRPGELRAAEWSEFDLEGDEPTWRVPAARMKMRDPHVVPLATQAVELLNELHAHTAHRGKFLFPALTTATRCMSSNTINHALRRMDWSGSEHVAHGFRTTASTLLHELGYDSRLIELCLAHADRNTTRATYNRSERMPERRRLMQSWADRLDVLRSNDSKVVAFKQEQHA